MSKPVINLSDAENLLDEENAEGIQDTGLDAAAAKILDDKKAIGKRIEESRTALGLNQSELARMVGVSAQAVQQWEKGETTPRGRNLTKISDSLQTTPEYLQFGIRQTKRTKNDNTKEIQVHIYSKAFERMFKEAVVDMVNSGCDLGWINCKSKSNMGALADIGLMKLRQNKTLKSSPSRE